MMTLTASLPLIMFAALLLLILCGYPVAFTLSGTALVFGAIGAGLGVFHWGDLGFVPTRIWGIIQNFTLVAVPLFVFMGLMLERSGLAEELLGTMGKLFRKQKASHAVAVVIVGALLAASTGIVGATVVTMGVLSLPTMLSRGYQKEFATGTIAASGTLGQIIPPSIVLVILGDMMNVDVGDLFTGAFLPGLLLMTLYLIYVKGRALLQPTCAPEREPPDPEFTGWTKAVRLASSLLPPAGLIFVVLGSILFGFASPTEAAACGAAGAVLIAAAKRQLTVKTLGDVMSRTARVTSMVFLILVGAQFFGVVFRGLGGDLMIADFVEGLGAAPGMILFSLMVVFFALGFFLDFLEICFIVIPIVLPILNHLGYDPLWVAVLIAVNLQTSFLTPPFGFALFYLKGVAPKEVTTLHIYRGVVPFVVIQLVALAALAAFPELALWLPREVFG